LVAVEILYGAAAIAVWLLGRAESYGSVKGQIALCTLAFVIASAAFPAAMLIGHRLFFGDWWPFFGPLASRNAMLASGFGISVQDRFDDASKARSSVREPGRVPAGFRSGLPFGFRSLSDTAPNVPVLRLAADECLK